MSKNELFVIFPDDDPTHDESSVYPRYKYSDELFDWFYGKVKYIGMDHEYVWTPFFLDEKRTRKDHRENGCRTYLMDSGYVKFYETYYLMEFTAKEWSQIQYRASRIEAPSMGDIIDYFYSERISLHQTKQLKNEDKKNISIYTVLLDLVEGSDIEEVFMVLHNVASDLDQRELLESQFEKSKLWKWSGNKN